MGHGSGQRIRDRRNRVRATKARSDFRSMCRKGGVIAGCKGREGGVDQIVWCKWYVVQMARQGMSPGA